MLSAWDLFSYLPPHWLSYDSCWFWSPTNHHALRIRHELPSIMSMVTACIKHGSISKYCFIDLHNKKDVNMDQSPYHSEECLIHVDVFVKETSTERKSTWHILLKQILYCNQAHACSLFSRVETAGCILSCPDFIS